MSVTNTTNRVQENGNGSKTAFDFSFKIFASSEVLVYDIVVATGVATLKTLSTHYTVSINAVTDGGTVTWLVAPASGHASLIIRSIPYTQTADLPTEGNFREDQVENQLDRAAMRDIQLEELISQCIKVPLTSDLTDLELPAADAGKALVWNATEDGFENSQFNPDDAETAATAAAASEAAAAASQSAAASSAAAAAVSAAAAAAATASLTNFWGGTVGGTADAITLTPSPVLSSYTTGTKITFKATGTNTGAATVNVSALGVKSLKTLSGAALTAGNITSGRVYTITYDGTNFVVHEMGTVEDGAITNAKVSASAGIVDTKLATISTAGKVDGAAITGLANLPGGAGDIPSANMSTNACVKTGTQTIAGAKTFSDVLTVSTGINMTGTLSGGSLGQTSVTLKSLGNGESWQATAGKYVMGGVRDSDGSFGGLYYASL